MNIETGVIAPRVGQSVLVRARRGDRTFGGKELPGVIENVHESGLVDVRVMPPNASAFTRKSIPYQSDPDIEVLGTVWRWPGFHVTPVARTEEKSVLGRITDEAQELKDRYQKLVSFLGSSASKALSFEHQQLLSQQKEVMKAYLIVLAKRINLMLTAD